MKFLVEVSDENLDAVVDPDANSIAIIVKHVGGTGRCAPDFLSTDGREVDTGRDDEFEIAGAGLSDGSPGSVGIRWTTWIARFLEALRPLRKPHGGPKRAALQRTESGFSEVIRKGIAPEDAPRTFRRSG